MDPCAREGDITEALEKAKSAHKRIDEQKERMDKYEDNQKILHNMNKNIAIIAEQNIGQEKQIEEVKKDVKDLKERPSKNWNTVTTAIITVLASGLAGAFLMLIIK